MRNFKGFLLHRFFLFALILIFFSSCRQDFFRIYPDSAFYSFDEENFFALDFSKLSSLQNLMQEKSGFIFVRFNYDFPLEKIKNPAMAVGKILLAAEVFCENQKIYEIGKFPPKKFSNGSLYNFIPLANLKNFKNPQNFTNAPSDFSQNENQNLQITFKIFVEGVGGISNLPFIAEYFDAKNFVAFSSFVRSKLYLIFAVILFFSSAIYLFLFICMQKDVKFLFFSLMAFFTVLFIFPNFFGEFPWLIGFMNYDWFLKIFFAIAALLASFFAVSFNLSYMRFEQSSVFLTLRILILCASLAFCLILPNAFYFYKFKIAIYFLVAFQNIFTIFAFFIHKKNLESNFKKSIKKILAGALPQEKKAQTPGEVIESATKFEFKNFPSKKVDEIVVAQSFFKEEPEENFYQTFLGFAPSILAIFADFILRVIFGFKNLPFFTIYGWQITVIMFLFILFVNFSNIKKRGEFILKNLHEIVAKNTEELEKKTRELEIKNFQSQKDIEMAAQVQKAFYPVATNFFGWDIATSFEPCSGVSGDLYDFYLIEGMLRGFGLFDVSGHGVSAALVTMLTKNSIFRAFRSSLPLSLSEAILRINDEIIRAKGSIENFLTGVLFRIDKDDPGKLEFVNAGHPYPILKRKNKKDAIFLRYSSTIESQRGMLGVDGLDVSFDVIPFTLDEGDILILYTDGFVECENSAGEQYGKTRLLKIVSKMKSEFSSSEILSKIKDDFSQFIQNSNPEDDMTLIVIKKSEELEYLTPQNESDLGFLEAVD